MFAIVVFNGYILVKFSEKGSQKTQKGNLKLVEYFMLYHILLFISQCGGDGSESRFTANVVSASSKEVVADTYLFDDEEAEIEDEGEEGKDEMVSGLHAVSVCL